MAVPFRRTSKTKKRMRRTHLKKTAQNVVVCPNCGEALLPHRACVKCGFYKGKNVLEKEDETKVVETKKKEKKPAAKKTSVKKETKSKETK